MKFTTLEKIMLFETRFELFILQSNQKYNKIFAFQG